MPPSTAPPRRPPNHPPPSSRPSSARPSSSGMTPSRPTAPPAAPRPPAQYAGYTPPPQSSLPTYQMSGNGSTAPRPSAGGGAARGGNLLTGHPLTAAEALSLRNNPPTPSYFSSGTAGNPQNNITASRSISAQPSTNAASVQSPGSVPIGFGAPSNPYPFGRPQQVSIGGGQDVGAGADDQLMAPTQAPPRRPIAPAVDTQTAEWNPNTATGTYQQGKIPLPATLPAPSRGVPDVQPAQQQSTPTNGTLGSALGGTPTEPAATGATPVATANQEAGPPYSSIPSDVSAEPVDPYDRGQSVDISPVPAMFRELTQQSAVYGDMALPPNYFYTWAISTVGPQAGQQQIADEMRYLAFSYYTSLPLPAGGIPGPDGVYATPPGFVDLMSTNQPPPGYRGPNAGTPTPPLPSVVPPPAAPAQPPAAPPTAPPAAAPPAAIAAGARRAPLAPGFTASGQQLFFPPGGVPGQKYYLQGGSYYPYMEPVSGSQQSSVTTPDMPPDDGPPYAPPPGGGTPTATYPTDYRMGPRQIPDALRAGEGQDVGSGGAGWYKPGVGAGNDSWRYDMDQGWQEPGVNSNVDGTQVQMGPGFNPQTRGQGLGF